MLRNLQTSEDFLIIAQVLTFENSPNYCKTIYLYNLLSPTARSRFSSQISTNMADKFPTLEQFRILETCTILFRYGDYLACHSTALKNMHEKILIEARETGLESEGLLNKNWKDVAEALENEQEAHQKWEQAWLPYFFKSIPKTPITDIIESLAASYRIPIEDAIFSIKFYAKRCMGLQQGINEEDFNDLQEAACFLFRDEEAILNGVLVEEVADEAPLLLDALSIYKMRDFDYINTRRDSRGVEVVNWYIGFSEAEAW